MIWFQEFLSNTNDYMVSNNHPYLLIQINYMVSNNQLYGFNYTNQLYGLYKLYKSIIQIIIIQINYTIIIQINYTIIIQIIIQINYTNQ